MKKIVSLLMVTLALILMLGACSKTASNGKDYQYYTAEEIKKFLEEGKDLLFVDIQVEEEWEAHHLKGAIPTYAYPVETEEDRKKIDAILPQLEGDQDIVVICPRGGGGATRTVDYLIEKGIDPNRIFILKGGQEKWPYDEFLE